MTRPQKKSPNTSKKGVWIFGYGSLMWNPGFACLEAQPGLLRGYHFWKWWSISVAARPEFKFSLTRKKRNPQPRRLPSDRYFPE
ncbi:MAG: gamma-glutamylcyclotransferase [Candidatus Binatia bacterium]